MNLYYPDVRTLRICEPIVYRQGKMGLLALHGYSGCPYSFREILDALKGLGYTIHIPRLPGHGTCGEDFVRSSWVDWLRRSVDAYYDLSSSCDQVDIIGFSMGGALTIILASMFKPRKVVVIAPALMLSDRKLVLSGLISLFKKKLRNNYSEKSDLPEYQYLINEYLSYYWPLQTKSLLKLAKMARRSLQDVVADMLILAGEKDDIVPLRAAKFAYQKVHSKSKMLKVFRESQHDLLNGPEKQNVVHEIVSWLKK